MTNLSRRLRSRLVGAILALTLAAPIGAPAPAWADPPPWAPAHGYRAKHRHHEEPPGYVIYQVPYGIDRGYCDRGLLSSEVLGGVVGGALGGVAGSQFGKGKGKTAATVGGAIIGVLVGATVGRTMDAVDQNCVGRALEYAPDRQRINWSNAENGLDYTVQPLRTYQREGLYCREYQTSARVGGRLQQVYGTACRQPDGAWKIMN